MTPEAPRPPSDNSANILSVPEVQDHATKEAATLAGQTYWRTAFDHATVQLTELVNPVPGGIRPYYIVGFQIGTRPTGRLMLDAQTGSVRAIAGVDETHAAMPVFLSRQEVLSQLIDRVITLPTELHGSFVASNATVDDHMVWQPCDQSRSPFQAFYVAREGVLQLFVRTDGAAFTGLTQQAAG
jgi:hypothetical protein